MTRLCFITHLPARRRYWRCTTAWISSTGTRSPSTWGRCNSRTGRSRGEERGRNSFFRDFECPPLLSRFSSFSLPLCGRVALTHRPVPEPQHTPTPPHQSSHLHPTDTHAWVIGASREERTLPRRDEWGEIDTRFSYCALSCCKLIGGAGLVHILFTQPVRST